MSQSARSAAGSRPGSATGSVGAKSGAGSFAGSQGSIRGRPGGASGQSSARSAGAPASGAEPSVNPSGSGVDNIPVGESAKGAGKAAWSDEPEDYDHDPRHPGKDGVPTSIKTALNGVIDSQRAELDMYEGMYRQNLSAKQQNLGDEEGWGKPVDGLFPKSADDTVRFTMFGDTLPTQHGGSPLSREMQESLPNPLMTSTTKSTR